ncbi:MAG: tetratricopeptide repeat protein [Patescibacteria group bacterium]|nr:tetratricopeptide repeat protein [Patescibacteria group bacterium]
MNTETVSRFSKTISLAASSAALLLTPLFFLPITTDFFGFQKQILFLILVSISLISWLIYSISTKSVRITISPMLAPLTLLATGTIVSTLIYSPNKIDAWLGRTSLFIGLAVFYLIFSTIIKSSRQVRKIINGLIIVSTIAALLGILSLSGAFANLSLPAYITAKTFTLLGSPLILAVFLAITLPLSLILAFKTRSGPFKLAYFLAAGINISTLILIGSQFLPGQNLNLILLPKVAGWSIAIDTFKTNFFLGSGPSSFLNQFTKLKPLSLNQTNFWSINSSVSSNEIFHLMTTLGLVGIVFFALMIVSFNKLVKKNKGTRVTASQLALTIATYIAFGLSLLIPYTNITWIILVGLLALTVGVNKQKNVSKVKDVVITLNAITLLESDHPTPKTEAKTPTAILPWLLTMPTIIGLIFAGIFFGKVYASEFHFKKSLDAAQKNLGGETYNLQIKAIEAYGRLDRHRISYSNTNLALANSLASQGELTDQDQQTVSQLIQQSIREARIATELNPFKSANWKNLANIYRQLVNFAEDADQFAVASYVQAIQLDPANPNLRIDLGGLMFSLKRYDEAIDRFTEAVNLKPDLANAYYNLSAAYRESDMPLEAFQTMQKVVAIIPTDSQDYTQALKELEELKANLPQQPAEKPQPQPQPRELSEPSPLPQAPEDFEPIEVEEPTPSPETEPKETE